MGSADRRFLLTAQRLVRPTSGSISRLHRPCVTEVTMQAANRCEANTGAVVFVGIGEDAADDGRCITDRGGIVWAQDAASDAISSMSDAARRTVAVRWTASREAFGAYLVKAPMQRPTIGGMAIDSAEQEKRL
jgi:chemosensory pili system protein ChpB (putative protein-glutamate methylesterase)